jgi:hypothetical protein
MRQLNNHIKEIIDPEKVIKTSPIIRNESFLGLKEQPNPKPKVKKDYTKAFVWILLGAITIAIWTTIYNLIF